MSRPSYHQIETLIKFLEENPGIAKGHLRSAHARQQTRQKWEEITQLLNSLGGAAKDAKSWAKFWADKKYALKKVVAQHRVSAARTGGGVEGLPPLTQLDERMLSLMGGNSFAEGDRELSAPLGVPLESEELRNEVFEMNIQLLSEAPSSSQNVETPPDLPTSPRRSPHQRRRQQLSQLNLERDRLLHIEEQRVSAELANAEALRSMAQALTRIADAVTSLTAALTVEEGIRPAW